MKKRQIFFFILIMVIGITFFNCDLMATLFHGEKPSVAYTVTFNANGAIGTPPEEQTVNAGTVIILPDKGGMTSTGNIFVGWNESASGGGTTYSVGASITVKRDMVFYAQWLDGSTPQYTVTFNANGATSGLAPASQTVYRGISITVPGQGTLSFSGKTFGGWNTQSNGGGTNYTFGATFTVTENVTLYAKWNISSSPITQTYTVTFNANGATSGTAPASVTVDSGSNITLPSGSGLTKTGYTFGGWNTNGSSTGINYNAGSSFTVDGNVTLYAKWNIISSPITQTYTVTFDANGVTSGTAPASVTVDSGSDITLPSGSGLTKTGYTFGGWNTNGSGTGINYNAGSSFTVDGNVTLYAKWNIISSPITQTYTVTFNSNGATSGTVPTSVTVNSGSNITLPSGSGLTKDGYVFGGWNTNSSGTGTNYNASSSFTVNSNVTLYAKWTTFIEIEMVQIPGGSFQMGSNSGNSYEKPVHTVTLSSFYMGKYEVTQEQWTAVMGNNPSNFKSSPASGEVQNKRPVERVSWYNALVFCNKLSMREGLNPAYKISGNIDPASWGTVPNGRHPTWDAVEIVAGSNGYRLPTEAQWEYAARGGNGSPGNYTYSGSDTVGDVAWYSSNSDSKTHEVGKKSPNSLGLYDMSGNVYEWCWDWFSESYYSSSPANDPGGAGSGSSRVLRGGGWDNSAVGTRSAYRYGNYPYNWGDAVGFRLVRP